MPIGVWLPGERIFRQFVQHLTRLIVLDSTPPGVPPAAVDLWLPAPGRLSPDAAAKNVNVLCDELVHE